jgi:amidophosphoribosyltransferase
MLAVFGILRSPEAANPPTTSACSQQHESRGGRIVTSDGTSSALSGHGYVIDVFPPDHLARLKGQNAIGHVRYSTAGGSFLKNAQPIAVDYARGSIAVAHNGNLTNAEALREKLESAARSSRAASDTETIVHLVAMSTQRAPRIASPTR